MQEILNLKQQLLLGNFDSSIDITIELETMARQDKINALSNCLTSILSRLIVIQLSDRISADNIIEIRNSLIQIQQGNRLGDRLYIEKDKEWCSIIERSFAVALLSATEDLWLQPEMNIDEVQSKLETQLVQTEVLLLIRLTYALNAWEIDRYLRFHWRGLTVA